MIYYSHRTRKALAEGKLFLPLGFAHYSYGTVCRKFLDMFEQARMPVQELLMPEIYPSSRHIFPPSKAARPLHIAFKPYEEIRLLKGAANVAHVAWEFDKLPRLGDLPHNHPRRANVMNDYVHVLGMVSEVWVGCTYTKRIFEEHGLNNVQIVPAPIAVGGSGRSLARQPGSASPRRTWRSISNVATLRCSTAAPCCTQRSAASPAAACFFPSSTPAIRARMPRR
jgi:hypothetical protein